jgi:uncharacterized DUF497 family protein
MLDIDALLGGIEGFQWDTGNTDKNVLGHGVSQSEAEEIFFHAPVVLFEDAKHSASERRFLIYGPTNAGRLLTAAFTIRVKRVRVISIRDMSRQERRQYAKAP